MPVIIMLSVAMILLTLYIGMNLYYRQKIEFIADQVAEWGASRVLGDGGQYDQYVISQLNSLANTLAADIGLPKLSCQCSETTQTLSVKLTMPTTNLFGINGSGGLPCPPVVETGGALIDNAQAKFSAILSTQNINNQYQWGRLVVPCFAAYSCLGSVCCNLVGPASPPLPMIGTRVVYNGDGDVWNPTTDTSIIWRTSTFESGSETWAPGTNLNQW